MSLLDNHLEQISLSASVISELPFSAPKIFTNALLHQHDITALIRDTELHERALFSVPAAPPKLTAQDPTSNTSRRKTTYNPNGVATTEDPIFNNVAATGPSRRKTAVAAVLGGDMVEQIKQRGGDNHSTSNYRAEDRTKGEVDVDLLLNGAEKLCGVYPVPGALDHIAVLKDRYQQLSSSINHHESRVNRQTAQLEKMTHSAQDDITDDDESHIEDTEPSRDESDFAEENIEDVEEEIRELEKKKRDLELRVSEMEKDLGGLMR